ncbi:ATP-binding cassette sub-family B member 5 isoform X5 [Dipodomys merriami]|uniref:ATP-binding cassette sub-family B member 5 isoform X5 n=1 Tax=Dipodomys merriami TaxID=94247 RepID=UPI003855F4EA
MENCERSEEMQDNYQRNGAFQEQPPKSRKQAVGAIEIFRFADGVDITLMALGILASLLNGACLPLLSLILGEMSDYLISGCLVQTNTTNYRNCTKTQEKLNEDMLMLTLYYVCIGVTALVFGYLQISFWVTTAARQTKRIREQFFHSILAQDISWFDGCDIGELNTRMTEDINKISDGIGDKIALLFQNMSTFTIGLAVGLMKGWKLTLVTLSTSPLIMASVAVCSRMVISLTSEELSAYAKAGAVAEEVLSSIQTVIAFGGQEKEIHRYTQNLQDAKDVGIKKAIASKLSLGAVYFFMNGTYGLAFWYGTSLILSGEPGYTIGTVLAVFFSVVHSSYCVGAAAPHFENFIAARGAAFNIFQVIDKIPSIDNFSTTGYKPECIEGTVEFKDVSFSYPSRPSIKVLKGLNLKVKSGETVALVGPSGSGKSTVAQLLQRLYDPDDGFITVDQNDIRALNVRHYREQIGVVSQEPVLFGTTIRNNISFGRDGVTDEEIERAAKEANAYDFIMEFPQDIQKADENTESTTCSTERDTSTLSLGAANSVQPDCSGKAEEPTCNKQRRLPEVPLLKIFKLNKSEWPFVVLGTLASVLNGSVHPVFSIVFAKMVTMFEHDNKTTLKHDAELYAMIFVILGIICFVSYFMQGLFYGRAGEILTMRLRQLAFKAMLYQDIAWFDDKENNTGALTTTLAIDIAQIQGAINTRIGVLTQNATNMGLSVIISFIYGWEMTLLILSIAPALTLTGMIETTAVTGFANKDKQELKRAGKIATEAVEHIRTIVSLTREKAFEQVYEETLQTQHRNSLKKAQIIGSCYAFSHAFVYFAYAAGFRFGVYLVQAGRMTPEGMFIVFTAIAYGAMAMGETLVLAPEYSKAKSGAAHLFALLEKKPTIDSYSQKGKKTHTCEGNLEFREVSFFYPCRPDVLILRGLSLCIEKGKTVAFVGSSGCGKSTSVQLLQRFYDPVRGIVLFDGVDVRELNVQWLRSQIATVSQEPVLFNCSIAENIAYGDNSRAVPLDDIKEAASAANIHSFIEGLPEKYNTQVGLKGAQLSGGQKQRLAIARALLRKPKILLLDEATSALDNENEKVVQQALDKARKGRTCLVVAHRLSTIQNADLIVVMHNGKIKEQGTHQELLRNRDMYFKLVNAQSVR